MPVDTNSLIVKLAPETDSSAMAPTRGIVYDTKCLMIMSFSPCVISFCPRDCNKSLIIR